MSEIILSARNLYKSFNLEAGFFAKKNQNVYAVNDISFDVERGQTYGIVGESGCGKTSTARLLVRMYEADSGEVLYKGRDEIEARNVLGFKKRELNEYRQKVKYIFQDPARSLNPRLTVADVLTDALRFGKTKSDGRELYSCAAKVIKEVGLSESDLERRPAEFSGGQRQRISIARALIMEPELLVCDEVVSALDVSIQGQILNLLQELRAKKNLSFVFITHDLKVATWFCDKIGVMYRGVLVEEAQAADLYKSALHPYTKILFDGARGLLQNGAQEVTTTLSKESGCPFAHRCPFAKERCFKELPPWKEAAPGQKLRCFLQF